MLIWWLKSLIEHIVSNQILNEHVTWDEAQCEIVSLLGEWLWCLLKFKNSDCSAPIAGLGLVKFLGISNGT
jgi:hypothetical protein